MTRKKTVVLSSPFMAGEQILTAIVGRLTGLSPSPDLTGGGFVSGHFMPEERVCASAEKRIFLVRNVYDIVIDQYRFLYRQHDEVTRQSLHDLPFQTALTSLIEGGIPCSPAPPQWCRQMQEMLRASVTEPCLVVSLERLLDDPKGQIARLADYLEVATGDDLVAALLEEVETRVSGTASPSGDFRYARAHEFIDRLTRGHLHKLRRILAEHAPDLGHFSSELGWPEVTADPWERVNADSSPLFVSTVFKSGTKLLEFIIAQSTGLGINAPDMSAGSDYASVAPISFRPGTFFIWHNVPGPAVTARLIAENAKVVFLVRNIFDLVVSQYFHLAHDLDSEIDYSTRTAEYFGQFNQEEGISLVICGATSDRFDWHGFGYYLKQIQLMLEFSKEYPCHLVVYSRLVLDKRHEIERLADYLGIELPADLLEELLQESELHRMREARIARVGSGNHFRKGATGDHVHVLKPHHYDMLSHLIREYAPGLPELCQQLDLVDILAKTLPGDAASEPLAIVAGAPGAEG